MNKQRELELRFGHNLEGEIVKQQDPKVKRLLLSALVYVRRAASLSLLQERRQQERKERQEKLKETEEKLKKLRRMGG